METREPHEPGMEQPDNDGRIGDLLRQITADLKTIARDEVELVRLELAHAAKAAAADAAFVMLGGIVGLIGLGLLCGVAVVALEPVIDPLWARMLIMAIVYIAIGGGVAAVFAKRLRGDAIPDLDAAAGHAKRTVDSVREGLH